MAVLKTILTVVLILISIIITAIILCQEGKLGAIAGASDTYWSKHKDRSMEGVLVKATRALVALFLILSIVLNIGSF